MIIELFLLIICIYDNWPAASLTLCHTPQLIHLFREKLSNNKIVKKWMWIF